LFDISQALFGFKIILTESSDLLDGCIGNFLLLGNVFDEFLGGNFGVDLVN
jgi:hypothetical protein